MASSKTASRAEELREQLKRWGYAYHVLDDPEVEDAAYVGDSPFDMGAAKAAHVFAVAVAWGGIHRVVDADVLVESPEELLGVL